MEKINKVKARKLYNEGKTIYIIPSKVGLWNNWVTPIPIKKGDESSMVVSEVFDVRINHFEYYNCNSQLGLVASYYIEIEGGQDE